MLVFIHATEELFVVREDSDYEPVVLLGKAQSTDEVTNILGDDWEQKCGPPGGIEWLSELEWGAVDDPALGVAVFPPRVEAQVLNF
jgi:hypothetical protein